MLNDSYILYEKINRIDFQQINHLNTFFLSQITYRLLFSRQPNPKHQNLSSSAFPQKLNQLACQQELALQLMDLTKPLSQSSPNFYSPLNSPSKQPTSPSSSPTSQPFNDDEYTLVVGERRPQLNPKLLPISQDLRIVEYNLVLATGIMRELNSGKKLQSNCYFGRYGQVGNIVISSQHSTFAAINQDIQAFVTYRNQLDAAWAIAALKDISHHRSFIKIHYGTSRYCSKYINDEECTLKGCYFNHKYRPEHRHKTELKDLVDEQYERVYRIINENLEYFVMKEYDEFKNKGKIEKPIKCHCNGYSKEINFPSFKSIFEKLIQQGKIGSKKYEETKNKIKKDIANNQKGSIKENHHRDVKSGLSDQEGSFKKINQDALLQTNLSSSMRSLPSPTLSSSESSFQDQSFDQIPPLTDEQQTDRITILKVTSKLMGRQFRQSRFKFVGYLDLKTTLNEQRKLQRIISKEIMNNC